MIDPLIPELILLVLRAGWFFLAVRELSILLQAKPRRASRHASVRVASAWACWWTIEMIVAWVAR